MANPITKRIIVFLDSGLQKIFVPLRKPLTFSALAKNYVIPDSLSEALKEIEQYEKEFPSDAKAVLDGIFANPEKKDCFFAPLPDTKAELDGILANPEKKSPSYLRSRFGEKNWHLKDGYAITLYGIWISVETNTSGQDANKHAVRYDRGIFYQSNNFTENEKNTFIEQHKKHESLPDGKDSPYIDLKENDVPCFYMKYHDHDSAEFKDFRNLKFELAIRTPGGEIRDVDVILDLGNTRSAGLLFDHLPDVTFAPQNFKKLFKILRIKPDPSSGEYDSLDDVDAGITQSWFVLHQLEHQKYLGKNDAKNPDLLVTEYQHLDVKEQSSGWIFKKTDYEIQGKVCERIPQMFMQLSPVLLGDQADWVFNGPDARAMISVGAKIQQSSPKRYYWDDTRSKVWWNMLLNKWDKAYNEKPENATALPTLQGEMLRFIPENGSILDLSVEREPADVPNAYPAEPSYPKQSTLTWFLLHILERAYSQTNSAFAKGADFIPHRLRKVLITYPSGWTNDEIDRYRERCQEALDIFSQTNIYHGVQSPFRLEMIPRENTPDEAVAGQLPFVFSEIIRYPGQTAAKWISLVGKKRQGTDTVRIMNFDIGGGTSDISVVEYKDLNKTAGVAQNLLSTCLLFKDGQAVAGDDLVKKIIEKIILGGLLRTKKTIPGFTERLVHKFTTAFQNKQEEAKRCRIIRTCLIPLATMCLSRLGNDSSVTVQFSVRDAGVLENNWNDFLDFVELPRDFDRNKVLFTFNSSEINELIDAQFTGLFQNCAMYAAAYDVDMLIFSGKPSELPYIKTMAKRYIPIDDSRIIFARDFKPGDWYPFTDVSTGCIKDAKTVTVVGCALYYALSNGFITGWKIEATKNISERNEWGQLDAMKMDREIFLSKDAEEAEVTILPNTIIARRQNICSSPEPVYKFIQKGDKFVNEPVKVCLKRKMNDGGESLSLESIDGDQAKVGDFELKLWPCEDGGGIVFWQERGIFDDLEVPKNDGFVS